MKKKQSPICPYTRIRLIRVDENTPEWKDCINKEFTVGYYSKQDGLDVIWLVDKDGEYCETIDHEALSGYFEILQESDNRDYFGDLVPD